MRLRMLVISAVAAVTVLFTFHGHNLLKNYVRQIPSKYQQGDKKLVYKTSKNYSIEIIEKLGFIQSMLSMHLASNKNKSETNFNYSKKTIALPVKVVPRIAVICYISRGDHSALTFLSMLYGSWKYVTDNANIYKDILPDPSNLHHIDLLAFCHPSVCPSLLNYCKQFNLRDNIKDTKMTCWAIEQPFESPVPYGPINSFVMFNRTDISVILEPYKKVMRSDYDVFITPALLTWKTPKQIMYGQGGYCDPFNMKRLKEISSKLHMRHQGVHCIGSTWFGETNIFIEVSKKTYELTEYMFLNEFNPNATGLETIDFKKNREGEWIRWWRPVSSMYAAELAMNDLIGNLSSGHKGKFDTTSCTKIYFLNSPHIHCWHDDCEFQKFKFMTQLNIAIQARESLPGEIVHRILENSYPFTNPKNTTIVQYSTFIAWNSVGKYLRKWFV